MHPKPRMAKILLLHGPNLNLLGRREPSIYGHDTLADIDARAAAQVAAAGQQLVCRQSNAEHQLIDWVQAAPGDGVDFIVINPGGYTHTSVALRDALAGVALPFIEVHLSNVAAREPFRRHSYFSDLALGTITGFGALGYELALTAALRRLGA